MRALLFCALTWVALPVMAEDESASRALLERCSENEAIEEVVGLDKLETTCPGLLRALGNLGFAGQLHYGWAESADLSMLLDLLALHSTFSGQPMSAAPNLESLNSTLADLGKIESSASPTWWDRVKAWLRELFASESATMPRWLQRFVDSLSGWEAVLEVVFYVMVGLVIAMAVGIVVVELRAAGVLGKRSAGGTRPIEALRRLHDARTLALADFDAAPWQQRPAILLRLLVLRLLELQRLRAERSLTHRELGRSAQFVETADGDRFANLALLAERLRFGGQSVSEPDAHESAIVADARTLLEKLSAEQRS